jgi:hypothetical protein
MLRSKKRTTTFEGPNRSARYTRSEACYVHARVEFARQCAARLLRSGAHVEADAGAGHIHAGYRRTRCPETVCAAARPPVCGQPRYRVTGGGLAVADRAGRHCRSPLRVYTNQISVLLNGFNDNSSCTYAAFRVTRFAHEVHESTSPLRPRRRREGRGGGFIATIGPGP